VNWDWTPCISVGEFKFGERFEPKKYSAEVALLEPDCEGAEWETYRVGDEEARVAVWDGVITSVECWHSMRFNGVEILGLSEEELPGVLGSVPQEKDRWPGGAQLNVEQLGITLWIEEDYVESATVWNPAAYDELDPA
jgi:hypothetical protein